MDRVTYTDTYTHPSWGRGTLKDQARDLSVIKILFL